MEQRRQNAGEAGGINRAFFYSDATVSYDMQVLKYAERFLMHNFALQKTDLFWFTILMQGLLFCPAKFLKRLLQQY